MTEQDARREFAKKMKAACRWWQAAEQTSNPDSAAYCAAIGDEIANQARREVRIWKEQNA